MHRTLIELSITNNQLKQSNNCPRPPLKEYSVDTSRCSLCTVFDISL